MIIELMTNEEDIVDSIANEDGYRFTAKGNITDTALRTWVSIIENRLRREGVTNSGSSIKEVIIIPGNKRIYKKNIKRAEESKVVSLADFCEDIKTAVIYITLVTEKIVDKYSLNIIMPLLMDCESIDSLFGADGEYIGSHKSVDDYMKI